MAHFMFIGGRPTFTFSSSVTDLQSGGAASITAPASIGAGDVLFFGNYASSGGAIPGAVTPAGFTGVIDTSIAASGSSGTISVRMTGFYKLADGSEAGATYTGMNGSGSSGIIFMVFKSFTGSFGTLTPLDVQQQTVRGSTPTPQTISCGSAVIPLVAFGMARRSASASGLSMSPNDQIISLPTAGFSVGYQIYNSNPSNVVVSCPDSGLENSLASFYLLGDV